MVRNKTIASIVLSLGFGALLIGHFARFFPLKGDLVAHFLLVNEIMTYGTVRPYPVANLDAMALYPAWSHWLAALVGFVSGSGLVGLIVVAIVSVYSLYLMLTKLVGSDKPTALLAFAVLFAALARTHSQVGWEVSGNFFYPQLVGDLLLFGTLLWFGRAGPLHWRSIGIIVIDAIAMFVQPLVALHILAAGMALTAWDGIEAWREQKALPRAQVAALLAIVAATILLLFHPSFRAMRKISEHDGELILGFAQPILAASVCLLIGCVSLYRRLAGKAEYLDAVLGSAAVASSGLMFLQFAAFHLAGAGSEYAIKKHIFIVVTLAVVNAARLVGARLRITWGLGWAAVPVLAAFMSLAVLRHFDTPISPAVRAIHYAKYAIKQGAPAAAIGQIVDVDSTQSPLLNLMVTMGVFEHRYQWFNGEDPLVDAKLAMVHRTAAIDANCSPRIAERSDYLLVPPGCLKLYTLGTTISFAANGNSALFTGIGWSMTESWGTWSNGGQDAEINLILPESAKGPHVLEADAQAFVGGAHPIQTVIVEANGKQIATWTFDENSRIGDRTADIPPHVGTLKITFKTPGAVSPYQVDASSTDTRVLGIGLKTISIR
jgi:hypothetical protein